MPETTFAEFLSESFDLLKSEVPQAHAELCRRLAPHEVHLRVDDEDVAVRFESTRARFLPAPCAASVGVETSRDTILALVDAETTLEDAVLDGPLVLRGHCDDLLAFHDGLVAYVHGAVRAPSFPGLLRRFRHAGEPQLTLSLAGSEERR